MKNKYFKKKVGQRKQVDKISAEWLKTAGYLDKEDQDKINYIFVPPKKKSENKIPGDAGHFIRTEIDYTNFKNENLITKRTRKNKDKTPYSRKTTEPKSNETIKILENIAVLEPGKSAQIAAKMIREKYKKIRSNETVATTNKKASIKEPEKVAIEEEPPTVSKISSIRTADKKKDKYLKIRREKSKKLTDQHKKNKLINVIDAIENVNKSSGKKQKKVAAEKILKKNTKI